MFSQTYLQDLHDVGSVQERVSLRSTRLYDFCDPVQRMEWLDVVVALVEYLRSGESRVGYLNAAVGKNMLHKSTTTMGESTEGGNKIEEDAGISNDIAEDVTSVREIRGIGGKVEKTGGTRLRRSSRKRPWEGIQQEEKGKGGTH